MRKERRVEIQAEFFFFGPRYPTRKVLGFDFVSIHASAPKLTIRSVQAHTMAARDERQRLFHICAQFGRGARAARIVARYSQSAAQFNRTRFKTANVVALPAMDRDGEAPQTLQRAFGVDSEFQETLAREGERFGNGLAAILH